MKMRPKYNPSFQDGLIVLKYHNAKKTPKITVRIIPTIQTEVGASEAVEKSTPNKTLISIPKMNETT